MLLRYFRELKQARRLTSTSNIPGWQQKILAEVEGFTMAGELRTLSTICVVEYIVKHKIPGAIVECGVWRGGQMMAAALTLIHFGEVRDIYLFDTFAGMTAPDDIDRDRGGISAMHTYNSLLSRPQGQRWCEAGIDDVRRNLASTGYSSSRMHLIEGDVEQTIPDLAPEVIAYLRLDTDWYASTAHELAHLYPRIAQRGVVTVDDYGHWQGAQQATDEFLERQGVVALLHRIDYSARQFVKV